MKQISNLGLSFYHSWRVSAWFWDRWQVIGRARSQKSTQTLQLSFSNHGLASSWDLACRLSLHSSHLAARWNPSGKWYCGLQLVIKSGWPDIYPGVPVSPTSVSLDFILYSCGCVWNQWTGGPYSERCIPWDGLNNENKSKEHKDVEPGSQGPGQRG